MRPLVGAGTALALASLGLTLDNLRRLRTPDTSAGPPTERVAVLVPARDEAAGIRDCVRALLDAVDGWPGPVEVLVLDDGSTDGTGTRVRELGDPRVRVLDGTPTPAGWLAKPWACHQLTAAAHPDTGVYVFVDADVLVAPAGLAATVDLLRRTGLDLVSPHPRQLAEGPAERLVQPLLAWSWLAMLPLGIAERSPRPSLSAANGQVLAVDATAYRAAGGHPRDRVLDDIALLRALKAAGRRGVVADGTPVATCRMYRGADELREGYAKSLWAAFGSPGGAVGVLALLGLVHVVPAVAALAGSRVGLVGYLAGVASRALAARRTGSRVGDAVAHPVSVLAVAALTADSWRRRRAGTLRWRGRPVEAAPESRPAAA
ncbi:glycosyltransferase [Actinomycetospora cinnamomea]|uniref:Glycosyl transferase family 2 n=1 Tax=Actinomycetospora cinnamomea TaxID=663609 RepID=A0A2U1F7Y4_9PSEU|nr:glycosyltransferase family 2 protein [Actinomycetospora cinnamomea]PVZ08259.1 glycosyl transferase family 2 [Actinomycetospora cinnamomea]